MLTLSNHINDRGYFSNPNIKGAIITTAAIVEKKLTMQHQ
jgi:hypothetical protein